jgi:outer membrane protein
MGRFVTAGILACCIYVTPAFAADVKLGYIDMQRTLISSEAGKEAKEHLAARVKKYQDEINIKQEELKKLKEELEKKSALLSESARSDKEKDYQQHLKEFQRFTKDAQEELQGKDEELTRKVIERVQSIIKDFGLKNGYSIILVKNESMLFADDKADVTDELLKLLNASQKK